MSEHDCAALGCRDVTLTRRQRDLLKTALAEAEVYLDATAEEIKGLMERLWR